MIEQAKFTCSPLGKALEKQTKTIQDQGKKQIKAIQDHGKQLDESNALINKNDSDTENELLLKAKEIYDKIVAERKNKINTLNNKIEYDKLTYRFKRKDRIPITFKEFNRPLGLLRKIKDGSIDLEKAKENQEKFRSNPSETTRAKWKLKSEEQ